MHGGRKDGVKGGKTGNLPFFLTHYSDHFDFWHLYPNMQFAPHTHHSIALRYLIMRFRCVNVPSPRSHSMDHSVPIPLLWPS